MVLAVTETELHQLLTEVSFTKQFGFRLHSFADGECTMLVPFQKDFERPGGIVAGQVFMAAAGVAMWLAIMTRLCKDRKAVSAAMKTNFLNRAPQANLPCHAKILKLGRPLTYGRRR